MCEIFSGHIICDKGDKNWGKVIYKGGIHHEKDREEIYTEYGQIKLAAWTTKKLNTFSKGVQIETCEGDLSEKEKSTLVQLIENWAKQQNEKELFLKLVSITQKGKPLARDKFTLDLPNGIFATQENDLVIDFSEVKEFTFKTGDYCIVKTGRSCTFKTGSSCTFDTGKECVYIRRDIYEIIEIPVDKKIKLNGYREKGFTVVEEKA